MVVGLGDAADNRTVPLVSMPPLREYRSAPLEFCVLRATDRSPADVSPNEEGVNRASIATPRDIGKNFVEIVYLCLPCRVVDDAPVLLQNAEIEALEDGRQHNERGLARGWRQLPVFGTA